MRIENQHKYRLRWWMILAAAGTLTIAIDSALDERWSTTVTCICSSYWLLIMHRFDNSSRLTLVERDEAEIVVSHADGRQKVISRPHIDSTHDTGPFLVVYINQNKKLVSYRLKRRHFDNHSWERIVDDARSWAIGRPQSTA
jgi:hypothetical protein